MPPKAKKPLSVLDAERVAINERALKVIERVEELTSAVKNCCIKSRAFPIYLCDLTSAVSTLEQLAAQDALLLKMKNDERIVKMAKNKARQQNKLLDVEGWG